MAVVRNLMVRAGADFSGLYKEMKTANTKMQGFSNNLSKAFKGAAIAGAALAVGTYMKDAVQKASDLNEAMSASGQVFGDAFGEIEKYANKGATALGQTRQQVYDAARQFGVFGNAAGLASGENAKFATNLVGLATDLASFNNTSVDDAITALSAGLRGESEPLRQFGILLDEATLRQQALKLGIVKTTKEALTPQQRVLAANAAIFAQTATQQGDFARTSGGLANQQRIFNAQLAEVKVNLGQAFLPLATTIMPLINSFVKSLIVVTTKVRDFILALYGKESKKVTDGNKNAINKNSKSYDSLAKSTLKARNAQKGFLAGFDEINAIAEKNADAIDTQTKSTENAATTQTKSGMPDGIPLGSTYEITPTINKSETMSALQDLFRTIRDDWNALIKSMGGIDWSAMWQGMSKSFDHIGAGLVQSMKGTWGLMLNTFDMNAWKDFAMGIAKIFGLDWLGKWIWEKLKAAFTWIYGLIETSFNVGKAIYEAITSKDNAKALSLGGQRIFDAISKPLESLGSFMKGILNGIIDAINAMIRGMNKISISLPKWVPGIGGNSYGVNIPTIPKLARGGIVNSPTIAQIGEAGKEMVVPLENTQFVDKLAGALGTAVMTAMQMGGSGASSGANIVIDGVALARAIQPYTSKESTRIGNSMIVAR